MIRRHRQELLFPIIASLALIACGQNKSDKGLPVGSACTQDHQCAGPGTPECLDAGLYPLAQLASSQNPTAQGLSSIGVPLPDGYCSTVPPCASDADCGTGGTCFFPLKNVDPTYFSGLVSALGLDPADAAVLESFISYGQCLQKCSGASDCTRSGYICDTPLKEFLSLVQGADMGTFCIGRQPSCDPACAHGTCDVQAKPPVCRCEAGWTGTDCNQNIDDCDPNPCQNGGTCADQVNGYVCSCINGFTGANCETPVSGCADSPCVHGTCTDTGPGTFTCDCQPGWEGPLCDQNIDDCDPNPCQNGGTCQDGIDEFSCDCTTAPGWTGQLCDERLPTTHCVLTYTLTRGNGNDGAGWTGCNLRVRDTTAGMGDGTHAVGPGTLILRVPSDGGQNPAAGTAEVLYYHLPQQFVQSTFGTTITTDVNAAAPELGATTNTTPVALGTLALGATPTITWQDCSYPSGYNNTNTSFTPDVVGTGAGCLAPYRSTGNVRCEGSFCSAGGLQVGDNPQDETWEQAMNTLTFSSGLASFKMNTLMLVPNRSPSRTYLSWEGTLVGSAVCD